MIVQPHSGHRRWVEVIKSLLKIDNSFLSAYGYGQISSDNNFKLDIKFNDIDELIMAIDEILLKISA